MPPPAAARPAVVRRLTAEDIPLIRAGTAETSWGPDNEMSEYRVEGLTGFFTNPANVMVGALDGDALVALAIAYVHDHPATSGQELYVHELDTRPDHRRQGLARAVMAVLGDVARSRGMAVWLVTEAGNVGARAFYRSLGFQPEQTVMYSLDAGQPASTVD